MNTQTTPSGYSSALLPASAVVLRRQLRLLCHNPATVVIGLLQPALYLVLFAPLLAPVAAASHASNRYTLFVPGLLVQLAIFNAAFTGYGLIGEWRDGVVEAERVTPADRTALLLGRLGRDLLQLLAQTIVLVLLGWAFGMDASPAGAAVGIAITLILGVACSAASNALALSVTDERMLGSIVNTLLMPVVLLAGILIPMQLGPGWLRSLSWLMPVRHVVDGVRSCFLGHVTAPSVLWSLLWAIALAALGIRWGAAAFGRDRS